MSFFYPVFLISVNLISPGIKNVNQNNFNGRNCAPKELCLAEVVIEVAGATESQFRLAPIKSPMLYPF